ncbi:MAG: hypothetical protein K2P53_03790 [Rickettsiales bacterium]|nr:hypothetical protein [Rickettsiales bacterium]
MRVSSIDDFRVLLKQCYQGIYQAFSALKVGNNDFQRIISEQLVSYDGENLLGLVQRSANGISPLRMQLKDISGIAANSFGYRIANAWVTDDLNKWKQILVVPVSALVSNDIITSIHEVSERYLDNFPKSIIDNDFFQETLFVISGCNELNDNALAALDALASKNSNILVLTDVTKRNTCLANTGYVVFKTGLRPPNGELQFDDRSTIQISGLEILAIEKEARGFSFRTDLVPGSVIEYVSDPVVEFSSSSAADFVLRGREHKVQHNIKFVIDFDELVQQLQEVFLKKSQKDSITHKYMAIAPSTTKDWFTTAITSDSDTGVIRTYNIGGRIITRNPKDNYLSYVDKVKTVIDNIIVKIGVTFKEEYEKISGKKSIPEDRMLIIVADKVRAELYKNSHIDVRRMKTVSEDFGGMLTTTDLKAPDIFYNDGMREPAYKELDSRLKTRGNLDFNSMVRIILENQPDLNNDIPEELYVLTASLFIAEVGRNPATFLPSLMLLDLSQKGSENGILGWDWDTMISQESLLNSLLYNPFDVITRCYGDFRGMHPMTHDGSYFQSQNICHIPFKDRAGLLSLVEYKSVSIMLDWLILSCKIKPMEKAFIKEYSMEIWPRFTGRLAKTNVIDQDIDVLRCLVQGREDVKNGFGEEILLNLINDGGKNINVKAALFGGALMKTIEVMPSIKYLFTHYVPILPYVKSYFKDTIFGEFISTNENMISLGLHFLGGIMVPYNLLCGTGLKQNIKYFAAPILSSTIYGVNKYTYDYRDSLLASLNSQESKSTLEEVGKFVSYVSIDVLTSLLISVPFGMTIGFSWKLLCYPVAQGVMTGILNYYNVFSESYTEKGASNAITDTLTSIAAIGFSYKLYYLPASTAEKIMVAAGTIQMLSLIHFFTKTVFHAIVNEIWYTDDSILTVEEPANSTTYHQEL